MGLQHEEPPGLVVGIDDAALCIQATMAETLV